MKSRALTKRNKCKCYTKNGGKTRHLTEAYKNAIYCRRQTVDKRWIKLLIIQKGCGTAWARGAVFTVRGPTTSFEVQLVGGCWGL